METNFVEDSGSLRGYILAWIFSVLTREVGRIPTFDEIRLGDHMADVVCANITPFNSLGCSTEGERNEAIDKLIEFIEHFVKWVIASGHSDQGIIHSRLGSAIYDEFVSPMQETFSKRAENKSLAGKRDVVNFFLSGMPDLCYYFYTGDDGRGYIGVRNTELTWPLPVGFVFPSKNNEFVTLAKNNRAHTEFNLVNWLRLIKNSFAWVHATGSVSFLKGIVSDEELGDLCINFYNDATQVPCNMLLNPTATIDYDGQISSRYSLMPVSIGEVSISHYVSDDDIASVNETGEIGQAFFSCKPWLAGYYAEDLEKFISDNRYFRYLCDGSIYLFEGVAVDKIGNGHITAIKADGVKRLIPANSVNRLVILNGRVERMLKPVSSEDWEASKKVIGAPIHYLK